MTAGIKLSGYAVRFGGNMMLKACLRLAVFISVIFLQQNFTFANSCLNVTVIGSHDESDLLIFEDNIYHAGTFRVQNEPNESKQPSFNFSTVNCRPSYGRKLVTG